MKNVRFLEIDIWRGFAVIAMIVFHFFYILDFFEFGNYEMYDGWFLVLARFVQFSFLLLVGVSLAVSSFGSVGFYNFFIRRFKRGLFIFLCAMSVSFVTWIFFGEEFVRFGILHLIAVSVVFWSFFVKIPFTALEVALFFLVFGFYIIPDFLGGTFSGGVSFFILGFDIGISSIDYFPIFPWLGVSGVGIFFGKLLYEKRKVGFLEYFPFLRFFILISQNSLLIYLLHIPLILVLFFVFGVISFNSLF